MLALRGEGSYTKGEFFEPMTIEGCGGTAQAGRLLHPAGAAAH